ncbi:hypothetical protein CSUI_001753, partial [Cystoisospora suis]
AKAGKSAKRMTVTIVYRSLLLYNYTTPSRNSDRARRTEEKGEKKECCF